MYFWTVIFLQILPKMFLYENCRKLLSELYYIFVFMFCIFHVKIIFLCDLATKTVYPKTLSEIVVLLSLYIL